MKTPVIEGKYRKFEELLYRMCEPVYRERPNCRQILNNVKEWTLDKNDLKLLKIFEEMPEIFNETDYEFFKIFFNDKKHKLNFCN